MRLHLGCGPGPQPANWTHVDGSWNARLSKFGFVRRCLAMAGVIPRELAESQWTPDVVTADLRRTLPFESGSAEYVYASHVFEHLYEDEARRLLAECRRVLKPHGVIRLVVPDLRAMVQRYVDSVSGQSRAAGQLPADELNQSLLLRPRSARRGRFLHRAYSAMTEFHSHKWMYDAESLISRLEQAQFSDVQQRGFLDSRIAGIDELERVDRVLNGAGVCVEGIKSA